MLDVTSGSAQSPWQRGSNEQTNGLLRQYFPKGMDLSNVHQNHLNAIARRLNERPRKTLGYYSPAEKFAEWVASTGWVSTCKADTRNDEFLRDQGGNERLDSQTDR